MQQSDREVRLFNYHLCDKRNWMRNGNGGRGGSRGEGVEEEEKEILMEEGR